VIWWMGWRPVRMFECTRPSLKIRPDTQSFSIWYWEEMDSNLQKETWSLETRLRRNTHVHIKMKRCQLSHDCLELVALLISSSCRRYDRTERNLCGPNLERPTLNLRNHSNSELCYVIREIDFAILNQVGFAAFVKS
jgi:hypothetical protein